MSKAINDETIALDGSDPLTTFATLNRVILNGDPGGRPTKATVTVRGPAVVYANELGQEPDLIKGNFSSYGQGGVIVVKGYDNMAAIKFGQLDSLTTKLYVVYEN